MTDYINNLPNEILVSIITNYLCQITEIISCTRVNRRWRNLTHNHLRYLTSIESYELPLKYLAPHYLFNST